MSACASARTRGPDLDGELANALTTPPAGTAALLQLKLLQHSVQHHTNTGATWVELVPHSTQNLTPKAAVAQLAVYTRCVTQAHTHTHACTHAYTHTHRRGLDGTTRYTLRSVEGAAAQYKVCTQCATQTNTTTKLLQPDMRKGCPQWAVRAAAAPPHLHHVGPPHLHRVGLGQRSRLCSRVECTPEKGKSAPEMRQCEARAFGCAR